jgi:signal transduction histidine kinase
MGKPINHELAELRSEFFDETDLIIAFFDKDLNYIDVNEGYLKTFRFKRKDVIGKNITDTSPDVKKTGRLKLYREVIRTGKTIVIDDMKPHSSLGNFHFRIKAFKLGDGLGTVTNNISDLKETIEELETFIYKSSHDMRAPIASILGLVNLAESGIKNVAEAKKYCKMVQHQTIRLDSILQILVETTRMRKDGKVIHLINFKKLVDEVEKALSMMNGFKEVRIEKKISVRQKFYSDKQLIVSLFQNLLENAIKYRKQNTESFIKIAIGDENDGVKITIFDNGIGIPEDLQKDVFKMFFRATDQANGSGLGLYTVKHTVKKLGGQIKLVSKEKIGTTFTVFIPNENPV